MVIYELNFARTRQGICEYGSSGAYKNENLDSDEHSATVAKIYIQTQNLGLDATLECYRSTVKAALSKALPHYNSSV